MANEACLKVENVSVDEDQGIDNLKRTAVGSVIPSEEVSCPVGEGEREP